MKSTQLHITTLAAAALVLLSGMYFAASAGQGVNRVVTRDAEVTATPAPVVDDTPINPDTAGRIKSGNASRNFKPAAQQHQKKRINRANN
jgi:hypothetical protein